MHRSGTEVENVITFSGCREYRAESQLQFDGPPEGGAGAAKPATDAPPINLSAGLPVTIELNDMIDSDAAARGDSFSGTVTKDVVDGGRVVIPQGAMAQGRIERLEIRERPPEVAIDLSVSSIRIGESERSIRLTGKPPERPAGSALAAILSTLSPGRVGSAAPPGGRPGSSGEPLKPIDELSLPGKHEILQRGFQTEWLTM